MGDGSKKEIKLISPGEEVFNSRGVTVPVFNRFEYDVNEPLVEIEMDDGVVIRCTKDHRILTPFGWKPAGQLLAGDELILIGS
jgi:intein/homing endonuclease